MFEAEEFSQVSVPLITPNPLKSLAARNSTRFSAKLYAKMLREFKWQIVRHSYNSKDKLTVSKESVVCVDNSLLDSRSLLVECVCSIEESTSLSLHGGCFVMLQYNCLAWEARLRMEFLSFMVRNFTTMGGAVAKVDEATAEFFRGR